MIDRFSKQIPRVFFPLFLFSLTIYSQQKQPLTIKDVFSNSVYFKFPIGLQWQPGGESFSRMKINWENRSRELWRYDLNSGQESALLTAEDLKFLPGRGWNYQWTPDGGALILTAGGDVWRYDLKAKSAKRLTETDAAEELVHVSPDGNWLSFVRGGNLFVVNIAAGAEKQLTFDGNDVILNGKFDWVYQEELVKRGQFKAYFWSPNSDRIAFLRFDQSPVPAYPMVDWNPVHPDLEMMRYPKAGDPNSIVKLGVVSINSGETVWLDDNSESDDYFPRVNWLPDGKTVAYQRLDRRQRNLSLRFADARTGKSRAVLTESDPDWINLNAHTYFYRDKKQFLWGSERSGFLHLYRYDYDGKLLNPVTSGEWLVDQFAGVDEKNDWIYFTATKKDIRERQLYRVKRDGAKLTQLSDGDGDHIIKMPPEARFYLDYFSNLTTRMEITTHRASGKTLGTILTDDYPELRQKFDLGAPELLTFSGDNHITYYATMLKPPDFDPQKKYPVLIHVYGGPHAQVVRNSNRGINSLWNQLLAQRGFIIFSMDNRGASGRGHAWETPISRRMGKIELEDQLRGVAYLKSLPFVDAARIGIEGGSYGGDMTLYAMTHSAAFRAGIADAAVTDWRNYDTAYTERYMGLPQENEDGYRDSAPVNAAENLHGKLLIIHGTSDENVHMQNSIQMIGALINAGKQFEQAFYPKQHHGVHGNARQHLYQLTLDFLEANLKNAVVDSVE